MRLVAVALAILMGTMAVLPVGAGQGSTVSECDPASCDPVVANGGQVKTGDEPVRVILFAHMRDVLQRSPLNTQPPGPQEGAVEPGGFLMPTVYTRTPVGPGFENNRFGWYFSPGPVEYQADGAWRVYQQPGFGAPFDLTSGDPTLYFYVSPGNGIADGQDPRVAPGFGVYARIVQGINPSPLASQLVAEGDTGTGYGDPQPGRVAQTTTMINLPGQDTVYEFRVPMEVVQPILRPDPEASRQQQGAFVEVVLYQLQTQAAGFTDSGWRVRGGPDFPPRLVVDLVAPLRTESSSIFTAPAGEGRVLGFEWSVHSTLGRYDVDAASVRIQVNGPSELSPSLVRVDDRWNISHDAMYAPVEFLWHHNLTQDPLADGVYHVNASVLNRQGTYMAQWNGSFEVRGGEPDVETAGPTSLEGSAAGIPGIVTAGILAAAAAVAGWARSRGR